MKKKKASVEVVDGRYRAMCDVLDAAQKVKFERDIRFIIRRLTEWVNEAEMDLQVTDSWPTSQEKSK